MSQTFDTDIRLPMGSMFTLLGIILVAAGFMATPEQLHKSLDINVDLYWGAAVLAFGVIMLALAFRRKKVQPTADAKPGSHASA